MNNERKCIYCETIKPISKFVVTTIPNSCFKDRAEIENYCYDCRFKSRCGTCLKVRDYNRFYLFRGKPNGKCKDCYIVGHRKKLRETPLF